MMDAVLLLTPRWTEHPMVDPRSEVLACIRGAADGTLNLTLSFPSRPYRAFIGVPCRVGPMEGVMNQAGGMKLWGLERLGPGVWRLDPSIQDDRTVLLTDGSEVKLHAYVVLRDVPEPAPFAGEPTE